MVCTSSHGMLHTDTGSVKHIKDRHWICMPPAMTLDLSLALVCSQVGATDPEQWEADDRSGGGAFPPGPA